MKKLNKISLEYVKAQEYIFENLKDLNKLSDAVLSYIDFSKGDFFTFLPDNADFERLYEFSYGNMIPQVPNVEKIYYISGVYPARGVDVINIDENIAKFIFEFLMENQGNAAIFDDFPARATDSSPGIDGATTLFIDNEVCHLLSKTMTLKNTIYTLEHTREAWHSLMLLSNSFTLHRTKLNEDDLEQMCVKTQYLIVNAYDGEGYLFWKKNE